MIPLDGGTCRGKVERRQKYSTVDSRCGSFEGLLSDLQRCAASYRLEYNGREGEEVEVEF